MPDNFNEDKSQLHHHAVIAGFGVPGRAVAEWMTKHGIGFIVIEANEKIVDRCGKTGTPIIKGDVRDEQVLRTAGIERAAYFASAVPMESATLEAVAIVRRLNPTVRIIARCTYISGGLEAMRRGAQQTIIAEQIVAQEFLRLLNSDPGGAPTGVVAK